MYAVAACDPAFQPTFTFPNSNESVTLNQSKLALHDGSEFSYPNEDYYFSGATANSYIHDIYYLGNPGNYQTVVLGVDDACQAEFFRDEQTWAKDGLANGTVRWWNVPPEPALGPEKPRSAAEKHWIQRLRRVTVMNLWAETAPLFGVVNSRVDYMTNDLNGAFQVGPDRFLTRIAIPTPNL
jgi:hypothetical protein